MTLKDDWVDENTPGKTAPDWTYTAAAANLVADAANLTTTKLAAVFHVDAYGADPTGVAASDTAVAAAITAMGTDPGILEFGCGTYQLNSTKTLAYPGQGIKGQGVGATMLDYRGTGDCLRVWDSGAPTDGSDSPGAAAPITGFRIYGYDNANTNICGLHLGDLLFPVITDLRIDGFNTTGSKGFWGENRYTWTERAFIQMDVEHCTQCYVFAAHASHPLGFTSWSFGYYFLSVVAGSGDTLLTLDNTYMEGADLRLFGGASPGDGNTGVVLQLGTDGSDVSQLSGHIFVDVETINSSGETPVAHTDINTPNSGVVSLQGTGVLRFNDNDGSFVAGSAGATTVKFGGNIDCPSLGHNYDGAFAVYPSLVSPSLTDPKINAILDTNGAIVLELGAWASADNYLGIYNRPAGGSPFIQAEGEDTNISIQFSPKGTGGFYAYAGSASVTALAFQAAGDATNVGWNFVTQAAGTMQVNGDPVGVKVAVPSTATSAGVVGQWAADDTALYICTATNVWRKVTIASW